MSVDIIIHQSDDFTTAPRWSRNGAGEHVRIIVRENNKDRVVWQGEKFDEKKWAEQIVESKRLSLEEKAYFEKR